MSRDMDALNEAAVAADVVIPIQFAELDFESGFVRVHSALGTITWGGYDWLGVGQLGSVEGLEERAELLRKVVTYNLAGVPSDLIAAALDENYLGRSAKTYIGFLNTTTYQLVATPELQDAGLMDTTKSKQGKTCSLAVTAESRMASWSRPVERRYTDTEQQARYPGDKGLEFVSQAAQKEIIWGRKA